MFHKKFNLIVPKSSLSISIFDQNGNSKLVLTPEFRQKIWQYLTNDLQEKHRDCQDFVQAIAPHFDGSALARIDYHTDLEFKNQEEYFNPGDVITWYQLLDNNQIKFTHFAVALGDGLYLCKFGLEIYWCSHHGINVSGL